MLESTGLVCGIMFQHESEKTLSGAGYRRWYYTVCQTIETHNPEVIVVNTGGNQSTKGALLL